MVSGDLPSKLQKAGIALDVIDKVFPSAMNFSYFASRSEDDFIALCQKYGVKEVAKIGNTFYAYVPKYGIAIIAYDN